MKIYRNISLHILCSSMFSILSPERPLAIRHQDGAYGLTLYSSNLIILFEIFMVITALNRGPTVIADSKEFSQVKCFSSGLFIFVFILRCVDETVTEILCNGFPYCNNMADLKFCKNATSWFPWNLPSTEWEPLYYGYNGQCDHTIVNHFSHNLLF